MEFDAILEASPGESLPYEWDYSEEDVFAGSFPITSATVTKADGTAVTGMTVDAPAIASPKVQTRFRAAAAGTYDLRCRAQNSKAPQPDVRDLYLRIIYRVPS